MMAPAGFSPSRKAPIGIIGGLGRLGGYLARLFRDTGRTVLVSDAAAGPISEDFLAACPVIFISVPIPAFEELIVALAPRLSPEQLVVDLTSVKVRPLELMLERCPGPVIGCHPLFGPRPEGIEGELVFYCPARPGPWLDWFSELWTGLGARLKEMDPAEHDRLMGIAQVLRQLMIYALERTLVESGFDPDRDAPLSGPLTAKLLDLIDNQRSQAAELYANIALANEYGRADFKIFSRVCREIQAALDKGDFEALLQAFGPGLAGERREDMVS